MPIREQECRILLDSWGSRTAASPKAGREEADRLLHEVELLGNQPVLRARALAVSGSSRRSLGEYARAHLNFAEARTIYRELGCPNRQVALDEADLRRRLALLHFSEGKPALAAPFPNWSSTITPPAIQHHREKTTTSRNECDRPATL